MKMFFRFLIFFSLILGSGFFISVEGQSKKAEREQAKADKKKEKQKKAYLVSQKKDKKRRFEMQSPETKKRMKETKKDARKINDQNHESFIKKLFHRKKKK